MPDPELKRKDKGANVTEAQELLNRNGAIIDPDGDFGGGTEDAVREFQAAAALPVTGIIDTATWQSLRMLPEPSSEIPTRAVAFIGREEVGSRKFYDVSGSRPTWPGGASGVTIGVGYDLGYQSTFDADWSDVLDPAQMTALRPWLGLKGETARPGPATLTAITIPWHAAWMVYIRRTLPQQITSTRNTFIRASEMPRLCLGVLVSLVYNRGTSMTDSPQLPGNRKEMRDIRDAVAAGRFEEIPAALRAMKRLWPEGNGLRERREREAKLFEEGLA
jgi:peptidoglycan hydrolase-like protein with peptidoglycan-binding domain